MTKNQMVLKMSRFHGIRYCMVEGGYISTQRYHEEMLEMMQQEGIVNIPKTKIECPLLQEVDDRLVHPFVD